MKTSERRETSAVPSPSKGTGGGAGAHRLRSAEGHVWRRMFGSTVTLSQPKLQKLSPTHKHIIARHLECWSAAAIAAELGMSQKQVIATLHDPLARELIEKWNASVDMELEALGTKAVAALRGAFENGSVSEQLQAVDRVFKAQGRYKASEAAPAASGEEVIARMLGLMLQQDESIRPLGRLRRPFVEATVLPPGEESK